MPRNNTHRGSRATAPPTARLLVVAGLCLIGALTDMCPAMADEICHFVGTTDYGGHLAIDTQLTAGGDARAMTRVDVRLQLDAAPLPLIHTHYRMQETSFWHADGLARLAVNSRYIFNGHIVRQQWDVYDRVETGLAAYRVQGKRLADFRQHHPGFTQHWDPADFGSPWLEDYPRAAPDRRPDLDLHHAMAGMRPPLALAFYWLRWLPPQTKVVPVFLPGFKEQKNVDLAIGPASGAGPASTSGAGPASTSGAGPPSTDGEDGQPVRQTSLHYPGLSLDRPSIVQAWLSPDRHLQRLDFDLHGVEHSARAMIRQTGCTGSMPLPPER